MAVEGAGLITQAAFQQADLQIIEFFLGLDIEPSDRSGIKGYSPMHHACQQGQVDLLKRLLDASVDVNVLSHDGESPLRVAVRAFLISGVQTA
ncbi:MAG: ankyrin repeat domain-containing protein [Burkholderiales bacterium]